MKKYSVMIGAIIAGVILLVVILDGLIGWNNGKVKQSPPANVSAKESVSGDAANQENLDKSDAVNLVRGDGRGILVVPEEEEMQFTKSTGDTTSGNTAIAAVLKEIAVDDKTGYIVFKILLNTHSVSLDTYDLTQISKVENDKGVIIEKGIRWEEAYNAGHHIQGELKVPISQDDRQLFDGDTKWLKLTITGIPKVATRTFIWDQELRFFRGDEE